RRHISTTIITQSCIKEEENMQVSVEVTSGLERRLTVGLPAENLDSVVEERLTQAQKNLRLPGFRPGKVPMREVRRRLGKDVRLEALGEIMQNTFFEAVQQENIEPAGMPRFEPISMEPGEDRSEERRVGTE